MRNRQFRHLLVESLEGRRLMAANPVAQNDSGYFTPVNTDLVIGTSSVHLLANDIDIDSTSYAPSLVASPSFGTLLSFGTNGSFTYRPNTGFKGIDTFTYKLNDGTLDSNVATVSIAVGTNLRARQNIESNVLQGKRTRRGEGFSLRSACVVG